MPSCPGCGAEITHAKTTSGENVPLERWTETSGGNRYRIMELGPPLIVKRVSEQSAIDAYPDHRKECPHHGNGLGL